MWNIVYEDHVIVNVVTFEDNFGNKNLVYDKIPSALVNRAPLKSDKN